MSTGCTDLKTDAQSQKAQPTLRAAGYHTCAGSPCHGETAAELLLLACLRKDFPNLTSTYQPFLAQKHNRQLLWTMPSSSCCCCHLIRDSMLTCTQPAHACRMDVYEDGQRPSWTHGIWQGLRPLRHTSIKTAGSTQIRLNLLQVDSITWRQQTSL